jgi:hypothetical protein
VNSDGGSASSSDGAPASWPMLVRRMATVTISAPDATPRIARLREVAVLASADEQARPIGAAGDDERIGGRRDVGVGGRVHPAILRPSSAATAG